MVPRRILLMAVIAIFFALIPQASMAQGKIAVEVVHSGKDIVGSRLAYQLKEGIRRSGGLRLTTLDEPRMIIYLVTTDEFDTPGTATIYSYTFVSKGSVGPPWFITSGVGSCGATRVNEAAETLVAHTDEEVDEIKRSFSK